MRSIGAIFTLTLRSLLRSRFLLCVALLSLAVTILLPLTVQDDGTVGGHVQVLIRYTLGAVAFLLSIGTLGAAPGLVAGELETRRLQQVLVKPVRFGQVWFGKWLALIAVNAAVLGGAVLLAGGLMRWTLRESRLEPDQVDELNRKVRLARRVVAPVEPRFSMPAVEARIQALRRQGELGENVSDRMARLMVLQRMRIERNTVAPGGMRRWVFPAARSMRPGLPRTLRVRFLSAVYVEHPEIEGEWTVGEPGKAPLFRARLPLRASLPQEIVVPPLNPEPEGPLEVTFRNVEKGGAATALFHLEEGARLLVPECSFGMNLFRAFCLILFKLALLAAVGITMGSLFSAPVAVLTAFFALVLIAFGGYIGWVSETGVFYISHEHDDEGPAVHEKETPGLAERAMTTIMKPVFRGFNRVLAPLRELEPMERVADGEMVPWPEVGRGLFILVGAGSGFMAALAIAVFGRRETG